MTATATACPVCTGDMYDNRESKRNPAQPDFKCKKDGKNGTTLCEGIIWPPRAKGPKSAKSCPKCQGPTEDCRAGKTNPKAPDYRCMKGRDECDGAIWGVPAGEPSCPTCESRMWDNRIGKKNPKAPDWKCRAKPCEGIIWPPRDGAADPYPAAAAAGASAPRAAAAPARAPAPTMALLEDEEMPF